MRTYAGDRFRRDLTIRWFEHEPPNISLISLARPAASSSSVSMTASHRLYGDHQALERLEFVTKRHPGRGLYLARGIFHRRFMADAFHVRSPRSTRSISSSPGIRALRKRPKAGADQALQQAPVFFSARHRHAEFSSTVSLQLEFSVLNGSASYPRSNILFFLFRLLGVFRGFRRRQKPQNTQKTRK